MKKLIETLSLKLTSKGKRVWLNGNELRKNNFGIGQSYSVEYDEEVVIVTVNPDGERTVVDRGDFPLIDLQNQKMTKSFPKNSRVHAQYFKNKIVIRAYHHDVKVDRRETRVKARQGLAVRIGELYAGFGLLSRQIKRGLLLAGISSQLCFANEYDRITADAHRANAEVWQHKSKDAVMVQDDLHTMDMNLVPQMDILIMGYPCVGFSTLQTNKKNKDIYHPDAGVLFVPTLEFINRANPALIVLENSPQMQGTITEYVMETVLSKTGYKWTQVTLTGQDYGGFEKRERLAKVYYSANLPELELKAKLEQLKRSNTRTVADITEPKTVNPSDWKTYSYLKKHASNKKHGHGFCEAAPTDTTLATMGASYAKQQPDSPFIPNPNGNGTHRMISTGEHCNVRQVSGALKSQIVSIEKGTHHLSNNRTNKTLAHRILGNSCSPEPWEALGQVIGSYLVETDTDTTLCLPSKPNKLHKVSANDEQLQLAI